MGASTTMASEAATATSQRRMAAGASCARRPDPIGGDKVNFFAHYEIDGEDENDVPHVLQLDEYRTTDDAEYDSWLLLEPLESPGGEGLGGEMEAGAAEPEEPAAEAMEVDAA